MEDFNRDPPKWNPNKAFAMYINYWYKINNGRLQEKKKKKKKSKKCGRKQIRKLGQGIRKQ